MQEKQTPEGEPIAVLFDDDEAETILLGLRRNRFEVELDGKMRPEDVDPLSLERALEAYDDYIQRVEDGHREAAPGFEVYIVAQGLTLLQQLHETGMAGGPSTYEELSADQVSPAVLSMHGMKARQMLAYQEIVVEPSSAD